METNEEQDIKIINPVSLKFQLEYLKWHDSPKKYLEFA